MFDFYNVFGYEAGAAVDPVYAVFGEVLLVGFVEALDVFISSVFHDWPVEWLVLRPAEAVVFCVPEGVGYICCVPGYFLGYAAVTQVRLACSVSYMFDIVPDVDTGAA